MRIAAQVHMAAPEHGAGAEWMLHAILRHMVSQGHEATILAGSAVAGVREFQGVEIIGSPSRGEIDCAWRWCDVAITHLDQTMQAQLNAHKFLKPLVHLIHNDQQILWNGISPGTAQLVVFNSKWLREANGWWGGDAMICYPPVDVDYYKGCQGGRSVTLINLSAAKGVLSFLAAARQMPDVQFIGVTGAWGPQVQQTIPNVDYIGRVDDIREVYRRTRVLLMPSWYESWGRCAVEAACSGIPTIAHPTSGLTEALAGAGLYVDRDNVDLMCSTIRAMLDEPQSYRIAATNARRRARELGKESAVQLSELERRMEALVGTKPEGLRRLHPSQQGWKP